METLFFTQTYRLCDAVNAFFMYSFLGWAMECVFVRLTEGYWENRGFVHAPFCIIYGFGGMLGYALLKPVSDNYLKLYIIGALLATIFELFTGLLMRRLFGMAWWDYSEKPLNYKGLICFESSVGWGIVAVLMFTVLQNGIFSVVMRIPSGKAELVSIFLLLAYSIDFAVSAHTAYARRDAQSDDVMEPPAV